MFVEVRLIPLNLFPLNIQINRNLNADNSETRDNGPKRWDVAGYDDLKEFEKSYPQDLRNKGKQWSIARWRRKKKDAIAPGTVYTNGWA